jgi:hypothetical protein
VPVRTAGPPPSRRRRRGIVLAALLTLVVVVGYGGYLAWNALVGGSDDADAPAATGYEATVSQAIFLGGAVLGLGVDTHLLNDLGPFADATDRAVFTVGADRARLERLAQTAPRPEAEVIASTVQSMDALQDAMIEWRNAVFNVRLGSVDDAHDAIDDALERLRGDLERWKQVSSDS